MEEKYPHPPMTFKKWVANFWYYYKWLFITAVIFVIFIAICIFQYASNEDADASILYVGSQMLSPTVCDDIKASVQGIMSEDSNGDGKKIIDMKTIDLSSDYDALINQYGNYSQAESLKDYNNELLAGDYCIMLLDPYFYDQLESTDVLSVLPGNISHGARIGDLEIKNLKGFSELDPDTVLCIRYPGTAGKTTKEEKEAIYESNFLVLQDILFYENK